MPQFKILQPVVHLLLPVARLPYLKELESQAKVLKINLGITRILLLKVAAMVMAGYAANLVASQYTLLGVLAGFFIPDVIWINKIRQKKEIIRRVFPESIDLMDLCIGAGLDFTTSIQWLVEKSEGNPFVEQLGIVLGEIRVGKPRAEALKSMAERLKIPDVSSFVRTVLQAERMGSSVEEAFRNLSEDTRNIRFQAGERYAVRASLMILFPLLFCILPVILIVVAGPIIIKFTSGGLLGGGPGF